MTGATWFVAVVSIVIGVGILAFWMVAIGTRHVPEIIEGRVDIWFHIAAEVVTGVALIAGGIGVIIDHEARWSVVLSSFGLGMLVYSLIASPGYYAERRNASAVAMFGSILAPAIAAITVRVVAG